MTRLDALLAMRRRRRAIRHQRRQVEAAFGLKPDLAWPWMAWSRVVSIGVGIVAGAAIGWWLP